MASPGEIVLRRRSLRLASKSDPPPSTTDEADRSSNSEEVKETSVKLEKVNDRSVSATGKGKRKSGGGEAAVSLTLRSGKKVCKVTPCDRSKGKSVRVDSNIAEVRSDKGNGKLPLNSVSVGVESSDASLNRRLTREEKGKGVMVEDDFKMEIDVSLDMELNQLVKNDSLVNLDLNSDSDVDVPVAKLEEDGHDETVNDAGRTYMDRFRSIAKRNAVRFAHFNAETGEGNVNGPFEVVRPSTVGISEAEDWPGPFSTAMKIIKDRANKANVQQRSSSGVFTTKDEPLWVPKQSIEPKQPKSVAPSLEDLSIDVLVKNVDAISSLNSVPDVIRHKLCQILSDSRKMSGNLFKLLLSGSPVEVRVKDSSWLTEEEFMEHFAGCDTSNLTVLQLDQCGRCMPDYVVHATLGRSSNSLPALAALSLQAACRLSDSGLSAILSAAPRLQSINLSQCSLLTSIGIESLTKSLGSVLNELYIDDCQSIDIMECLPCLKDIKCLEVLSVAGIESVCDDFIKELMLMHGQCLKELILANCMNLTDGSLKAIAENSSSLCSMNLVNISNLTDIGIGYLANGILKFKTLKFCRSAFSDEALAAFVETCGDCLEELWLNNINMVGRCTAVSLAKRSKKLVTLDLSWCRNLTDDSLGLIVDSCDSLRILKVFGCTQLTDVFFNGHSNLNVQVIGRKMTPILKHIKSPNQLQGPLRYSSVLAV